MWVHVGQTHVGALRSSMGLMTDVAVYSVVDQHMIRVHHVPSGWWIGIPIEEFPAHVLKAGYDTWRTVALHMALHTLKELQ